MFLPRVSVRSPNNVSVLSELFHNRTLYHHAYCNASHSSRDFKISEVTSDKYISDKIKHTKKSHSVYFLLIPSAVFTVQDKVIIPEGNYIYLVFIWLSSF